MKFFIYNTKKKIQKLSDLCKKKGLNYIVILKSILEFKQQYKKIKQIFINNDILKYLDKNFLNNKTNSSDFNALNCLYLANNFNLAIYKKPSFFVNDFKCNIKETFVKKPSNNIFYSELFLSVDIKNNKKYTLNIITNI